MTSSDVSPPNQIPQDHPWQTLIEYTLPGEAISEAPAVDRVVEAVQELNWPATHLERLKLALVKAIRNTLERSQLSDSRMALHIRVLIPESSEATPKSTQVGSKTIQGQVFEKATQPADLTTTRGWGFFLVQKQAHMSQDPIGELHNVIELFLYKEKPK